ncbi:nitronate monooxygenase, partial [Escherichia coli]|nr:nitronate monooxygenase [Escherichia coli]
VAASVRQALKAETAGADIIAAEGYEAAGINSSLETTTLVLIPQITGVVSVPVVAAGGIGDGKGLAAMLALGASGVQMGTRF